MSLVAGDIFEGMYQLEESVDMDDKWPITRWRADNISAYRRAEVLIDILSDKYDPQLHWCGNIEGLCKVGQSTVANCRYFVWDLNRAQLLVPVEVTALNAAEQHKYNELIDVIPIAAHENIKASEPPEVWRANSGEFLIMYRKHEDDSHSFQHNQQVRELWKKRDSDSAEDVTDPLPEPAVTPPANPAGSNGTPWLLLIIGLGILSVIGLYQTIPPKPSAGFISFQRSLESGIAEEKKGAYESALEHFKAAAAAPQDIEMDARLDSLATLYRMRARQECAKFKDSGSADLYFIPNQYFNYAAVLSRNPNPEICQ